MRPTGGLIAVIVALGALLADGGAAVAGPPTEQLKRAADQIVQLLVDPSLKGPDQLQERRRRIRTVANDTFDWHETARRTLGRHWSDRTPEERADFAALFADFIEQAYLGKIELYSGERIAYVAELGDATHATVRTKLLTASKTEIPVDYRMLKDGERWRVYDVVVEGVSLVANYRTQFARIIQQSGFPELMKKLRSKQELGPESVSGAKTQS
jgi:phospholipid transport system substrate-binding protein